jgi:hypothetical protein
MVCGRAPPDARPQQRLTVYALGANRLTGVCTPRLRTAFGVGEATTCPGEPVDTR